MERYPDRMYIAMANIAHNTTNSTSSHDVKYDHIPVVHDDDPVPVLVPVPLADGVDAARLVTSVGVVVVVVS